MSNMLSKEAKSLFADGRDGSEEKKLTACQRMPKKTPATPSAANY